MWFRVILLAVLAYVIISYIRRIFIASDERNSQYNGGKKQKEGDVTVENSGQKKKTINKDEGDYIDYEEIK